MRARLLLPLLLLLLLPAPPGRADDLAGPAVRAVEVLIRDEMRRQEIPGLSVAVVRANRRVWAKGFGLSDIENAVLASPETVYRPVQKYVSAFPVKPWPVTVRQLLNHQGGVRHYNSPAEFDSTRHYARLADTLPIFAADPLLHEPGTKYLYTTYGYTLLDLVIEAASGNTMRSRCAQPFLNRPA